MKKPDLDQFFTPVATARKCIEEVSKRYDLTKYDHIIEPSAGSGAFFNQLPDNKIGFDLEPQTQNVTKQDFLTVSVPGTNIVIGNPPYGRRGSLALKFINRCADFSEVIAFILPRGFMRTAMQNSIDRRFHLVYQEMVEDFEFPDGTKYKVKSVFQIWEKRDYLRDLIEEPTSHTDFDLFHRHISWITDEELVAIKKEYPYAIGQNRMKIVDSATINKGSVWFVKPNVPGVREVFERCTFEEAYYTTGAPSLSKGNIINGYIAASEKRN